MKQAINILLVEDDLLDVKNVRRAFAEIKITNPLQVVTNGEEALAYLRREPPYEDATQYPRPGLILLDINMPIMNGIEFLRAYKADPELKAIPAVILTTSDQERDRLESYKLGAAGYIVKPVSFNTFVDAIKRFDMYWTLCELPFKPGEDEDE